MPSIVGIPLPDQQRDREHREEHAAAREQRAREQRTTDELPEPADVAAERCRHHERADGGDGVQRGTQRDAWTRHAAIAIARHKPDPRRAPTVRTVRCPRREQHRDDGERQRACRSRRRSPQRAGHVVRAPTPLRRSRGTHRPTDSKAHTTTRRRLRAPAGVVAARRPRPVRTRCRTRTSRARR